MKLLTNIRTVYLAKKCFGTQLEAKKTWDPWQDSMILTFV